MKSKSAIPWIFAVLGVLAVAIPAFFITPEAYTGDSAAQAAGRFHILVLHFPIALLMLVPIMEIAGLMKRWRHLKEAVPQVLVLCALFSIITCVLGLMLAAGEGMEGSLIRSHMLAGILAAVLVICLAVIRGSPSQKPGPKRLLAYSLLLISGISVLIFGSHQGASMVHGKDYLFEHLPPGLQALAGYRPEEAVRVDYDSAAYEALIVPILEQNCYTCHDDSLTKGGYIMDSLAGLTAGGKSGLPAIVPGDSGASELVRRVMLDRSDEEAMPPVEKQALEAADMALLKWWIDGGADADITIADLSYDHYPEEVEKIITSLIMGGQKVEPLDWKMLEQAAVASKENHGIDVIPYSQDPADGVYVVARNAGKEIGSSALAELEAIGQHVLSINLWNRNLQDDALSTVGAFSNLRELHLNQTNVTGDDLRHLASLRRLQVLNLHGTAIGNDALPLLSAMRSLKKLYLSNTRIDEDGISGLQQDLPNCEVIWLDPAGELAGAKPPIRLEYATFEAVPGWGLQNVETHDHGMGSTHGGVAIDAAGTIYVSSHTGIHLFDAKGNQINAYTGPEYSDIHAMSIVEEGGVEYIYAARNRNAEVLKLTTGGEVVLTIPYPPEAGEGEKYMPTAVTRIADGSILVTDGYGSNRVFRFTQDGKFIETFGGMDIDDIEKFKTPHGVSIDTRYDPVRLLISDREKRRLVHFDLEGKFIGEVITELRRPCAVSILGKYLAVAELEGRVVILNGDNQIIHELGDNPNESEWAKFKVDPADWKDGIHTAPHGLAWDVDGNLYVQDWNSHGRITKWQRVVEETGY